MQTILRAMRSCNLQVRLCRCDHAIQRAIVLHRRGRAGGVVSATQPKSIQDTKNTPNVDSAGYETRKRSFISPVPRSPQTGLQTASDPNAELIQSLLLASSSEIFKSLTSAQDALMTGASRVMRLVEPPPQGFPPGPPGEQAPNLLQDPLQFLRSTTAQYGSVVGLLLGTERVVLVTSKEAAHQVMVSQADVFIKQGTAFFPGSALAGNGLLVSDGDIWRRQRRLSNPAFRKSAIDNYATAMVNSTQSMLSTTWRSGGTRDVYADFNKLTLEITLEALFGFAIATPQANAASHNGSSSSSRANTTSSSRGSSSSSSRGNSTSSSSFMRPDEKDQAEQIVAAVAKAFEFFTRRAGSAFVLPEWVPTLDNLEFGAAVQQLDKVVYSIISSRRQELADASAPARTDLLQSLLTAEDETGTGMSDQSLRDELMTMLVAGQETSAILLGWACALLAHNPAVQDTAVQELSSVLQGRVPQASDVRSLKYIEAIVLESLRLYAPAYLVGRCACRDVQLGQYNLEAGTTVLISPYMLHRSPDYWDDPDSFLPERWLPLQQQPGYAGFMTFMSNVGEAVNGAYVPFGAGPRNCIGTGFAMMEAILVIASVLQRYRLKPAASSPGFPNPKPLITLRPEAVHLLITAR